jgi:predicted ATP-dependent serine protease
VLWDEFAAHLSQTRRTARGFDQNRAFVGMALMFKPKARVEFGYQNQFVYSSVGAHRRNHILSGVLAITLR